MESKNILIVDDQKNVAFILATSLSKKINYHVETAHTGRTTLEKCSQQFYDLVVADYQLPDMTGIDISKKLKEISPKTKIVLITALSANMIDDSIEQENIYYFLEKPFPLKKFTDVIEGAFGDVI